MDSLSMWVASVKLCCVVAKIISVALAFYSREKLMLPEYVRE